MCIRVLIVAFAACCRSPRLATMGAAGLTAAILLASGLAWADDFVLIRNAKNASASISAAEVKEMTIGKKKVWPSGAVVGLVLTQPGTPEFTWLASRVCGVGEGALMSKIKQEVFKGELRKPVIVASGSDKEIVAAVAADEGAIGIVKADVAKSLPATVAILALK